MDKVATPVILDCTVRDGNYSVGFKFTDADTRLLTGQLAGLGFEWIEVGHGLGLGAMEAGKGDMPASDAELIRAAKQACEGARIGMFFIPGIGQMDHLAMARDAGLDFVRIGDEAREIERAFAYVTRARELGLTPCINMMKSYGVTPEVFAQKARGAIEAGAEIVYCVDSAGSMLPDDVARYYDATRAIVNCELGFHGHNNLMMVIANCLAALDHGARYLDATLCGLGRSAGNAPTEILVAVLERLGIKTGIDLFEVMDVIEQYMWPLVAQTRPHDMMGVTAGYSQFHSSFLPRVIEVARKHHVELRRLVYKVAFHDPIELQDDYLEQAAQELAHTDNQRPSDALLSFYAPEISKKRISHSIHSVNALIEGMVAASSKRAGTQTVLHLVPSEDSTEGLLLPEFVLGDHQMVMGRITFGSFDVLREVVNRTKSNIFMFLINREFGWAAQAPEVVAEVVDAEKIAVIRDLEQRKLYLIEALDRVGQRFGRDALLIYCPDEFLLEVLEAGLGFDQVFLFGSNRVPKGVAAKVVALNGLGDWRNLNLQFNVVLCGANPTQEDARTLSRSLGSGGKVLSTMPLLGNELIEAAGDRLIHLDLNMAYSGIISRFLAMENGFNYHGVV